MPRLSGSARSITRSEPKSVTLSGVVGYCISGFLKSGVNLLGLFGFAHPTQACSTEEVVARCCSVKIDFIEHVSVDLMGIKCRGGRIVGGT